jgi:hypothetical protein
MPTISSQFKAMCRARSRNAAAVRWQLATPPGLPVHLPLTRQLNILMPPQLFEWFAELGHPSLRIRHLLSEFLANPNPAAVAFAPTGLNTVQFNFRLDAALHDQLQWYCVRRQLRVGATVRALMCSLLHAAEPLT